MRDACDSKFKRNKRKNYRWFALSVEADLSYPSKETKTRDEKSCGAKSMLCSERFSFLKNCGGVIVEYAKQNFCIKQVVNLHTNIKRLKADL